MEEHVEAVQRMQDYIQQNLDKDITMAELARISQYSPWYSYRLFVKLLEMTPAVYIRRLRLSKSALRLRDEKIRIIDVAFDAGFESVDGYQRAFYKEFGCNPYEYSMCPVPIYLFKPYGIKYSKRNEDTKVSDVKSVFVQVVEKPERKVIIKRGKEATEYWKYCEEVGCDVWGLLSSIKSISGEPVCLWLPQKYIKAGTSEYVQGVEVPVNFRGEIPNGFDVIELPKCKYIMFQGEPFEEANFGEAIQQIMEAIKKYNPQQIGYQWDISNPRIQLEPIGTRGYIELHPIKEI
ncbi:MAG: AraC family transcriptional regulator [Lachnospiraceae bacterium]|nr:AraC family transcriptional regulator [Lachnospiraceae bacterium]MBQ7781988.1 AraC family transcriptional regulator [Lachnospiraceae bacterium]